MNWINSICEWTVLWTRSNISLKRFNWKQLVHELGMINTPRTARRLSRFSGKKKICLFLTQSYRMTSDYLEYKTKTYFVLLKFESSSSYCNCMEKLTSTFFLIFHFFHWRRKLSTFGTTQGWVNNDISIFGWTVSFTLKTNMLHYRQDRSGRHSYLLIPPIHRSWYM